MKLKNIDDSTLSTEFSTNLYGKLKVKALYDPYNALKIKTIVSHKHTYQSVDFDENFTQEIQFQIADAGVMYSAYFYQFWRCYWKAAKMLLSINKVGGIGVLKGVSKNVVEVRNPNSQYFDRAILFLKETQSPEPMRLSSLADAYLREADHNYRGHLVLRVITAVLRFILAACSGAAVTVLLLQ